MAHSVKNQGSHRHSRCTPDRVRDQDSLALSPTRNRRLKLRTRSGAGAASQFETGILQSLSARVAVKANDPLTTLALGPIYTMRPHTPLPAPAPRPVRSISYAHLRRCPRARPAQSPRPPDCIARPGSPARPAGKGCRFLIDMMAQRIDIPAGIDDSSVRADASPAANRRRLAHGADESPALLMLGQHHRDRSALPRQTSRPPSLRKVRPFPSCGGIHPQSL